MGLDVYFIPSLDIEKIKEDENLVIDGSFIQLNDTESKIRTYAEEFGTYEDYFRVSSDSVPLIKYLCEKYHLLVGADGFFEDAGYCFMMDAFHYGFYDYDSVVTEMLKHSDVYKWSDEYIEELNSKLNIKLNIEGIKDVSPF